MRMIAMATAPNLRRLRRAVHTIRRTPQPQVRRRAAPTTHRIPTLPATLRGSISRTCHKTIWDTSLHRLLARHPHLSRALAAAIPRKVLPVPRPPARLVHRDHHRLLPGHRLLVAITRQTM